ncbi:MAG TPA: TonB-dependent receptor, partial [Caldithrix abyssi]|nr:TonB-dependent receptor [Caldithrix abyssi]
MKTILFYLASFLLFVSLFAGTTGKISGVVKDADTGEPLPGANVVIEGTALGASTDMDGFYSIINVPPGVYTLRVIYIGYADQIIKNVKVEIDLTTQISISLKSTVLSAESVEVIATRPVVQKDISNSQINLEVEKIEALPVTTVKDALSLQAGIESSTAGLIIRGGGPNQVVFMIDGFSTNDERSNYPNTAIAIGNIVEVQVQTGGFNAEYEQARSGIVNVVTAEGDKQK